MGMVRIGQTGVAYELRRSPAASQRRITVTPGHVEVLALTTNDDAEINAFLTRKRQWLFNTLRELETATAKRAVVPRFMTGSKIPFRGRNVRLTVRRHDGAHVEISYRSGFLVDLPSWVRHEDSDSIVATEIKLWLKRRVRRDVMEIVTAYRKRFGLKPRTIRVADMKTGWGACGPTGAVLINWTLIFAPKAVLEYVVVHELAHLKVRSHGPEFWAYLATLLPGFERQKGWLDTHQAVGPDVFGLGESNLMKFFVGWDVGGWHCDRNRESRDALVSLTLDVEGQPRLIGRAWRGNLRAVLTEHTGAEVIRQMLRLCEVELTDDDAVSFAIDAPLGWPSPMLALAAGGSTKYVSGNDSENPYTRRETELDLIRQGFTPLSNVRDMIGSQSTKAIHFLSVARMTPRPRAVWSDGQNSAIETYPAVALKDPHCATLHGALFSKLLASQAVTNRASPDVRDALVCAVVAYLSGTMPEAFVEPPMDYPALEGWIIVPMQR